VGEYLNMQAEPQAVFTIKEFCDRFRIATSFYFKLQKQGKGPRTMRIGSKVLISAQAASDWAAAIEAESLGYPTTLPATG
jgi:hypothetical protein